jgi:hypothetical protein
MSANVSQVWYALLVDGAPYGADLIGYQGATVLYLSPASTHVFGNEILFNC